MLRGQPLQSPLVCRVSRPMATVTASLMSVTYRSWEILIRRQGIGFWRTVSKQWSDTQESRKASKLSSIFWNTSSRCKSVEPRYSRNCLPEVAPPTGTGRCFGRSYHLECKPSWNPDVPPYLGYSNQVCIYEPESQCCHLSVLINPDELDAHSLLRHRIKLRLSWYDTRVACSSYVYE